MAKYEFKMEVEAETPDDALAIVVAIAEDMLLETGDYGLLEEIPPPIQHGEVLV